MKRYITQVRRFVSKNVSIPVMVALVFVGGAAVAKVKLSHRIAPPNYYNSGTKLSPVWNTLTRTQGDNSGQYSCSDDDNYCTAHFASTPSAGQIPTDFEGGVYSVNP